jgi:hypothetical protein
MPTSQWLTIARICGSIYRGLLLVYPAELRRRFGQEMQDVFVALLCDAIVKRSAMEVFLVWRLALWELLTVALPSRLASSAVMAGALSFLASAALFLVFFRAVS